MEFTKKGRNWSLQQVLIPSSKILKRSSVRTVLREVLQGIAVPPSLRLLFPDNILTVLEETVTVRSETETATPPTEAAQEDLISIIMTTGTGIITGGVH